MKFSRTVKNVIMIVMVIALGAGAYFTMDYAGEQLNESSREQFSFMAQPGGNDNMNKGQKPSGGGNEETTETDGTQSENDASVIENFGKDTTETSNTNEPPQMQNGEMPSGNQPSDMKGNNASGERPEMPSGETPSGEMPSGEMPSGKMPSGETADSNAGESSDNGQTAPDFSQMPDMSQIEAETTSSKKLDTFFYVLFAAESLELAAIVIYLILSGFNKRGLRETFKSIKNVIIYTLSVLILTAGLTAGEAQLTTKCFAASSQSSHQSQTATESSSADAAGATVVDGEEQELKDSYTSSDSDESPILVKNGGNATISGAKISKTGDSSNTENSEFYA